MLDLLDKHEVRFHWVKGHADNPYNNRCDELGGRANTRNTSEEPDFMERMRRARNGMLGFYYVVTACGAVLCLRRDAARVQSAARAGGGACVPLASHMCCTGVCRICGRCTCSRSCSTGLCSRRCRLPACSAGTILCRTGIRSCTSCPASCSRRWARWCTFPCKPGHRARAGGRGQCAALFTWVFAVLSAVLWEIWEYIVSLSGADPQQVAATGVGDTMQDMSVCTLGGLFTAALVLEVPAAFG